MTNITVFHNFDHKVDDADYLTTVEEIEFGKPFYCQHSTSIFIKLKTGNGVEEPIDFSYFLVLDSNQVVASANEANFHIKYIELEIVSHEL